MELAVRLCISFNRAAWLGRMRQLFRIVSRLGNGVFWYVLMVALLAFYGDAAVRTVLHMVIVGLLCSLVSRGLKVRTFRPRPYQVSQAITCNARPLDPYSFRSGHTLHAVASRPLLRPAIRNSFGRWFRLHLWLHCPAWSSVCTIRATFLRVAASAPSSPAFPFISESPGQTVHDRRARFIDTRQIYCDNGRASRADKSTRIGPVRRQFHKKSYTFGRNIVESLAQTP